MTLEFMEGILCSGCDEHLDLSDSRDGFCRCERCGTINVLPFENQSPELVQNLRNANNQFFASEFYNAFNSYRSVTDLDGKNAGAFFATAFANNRVKYVFDTVTKNYCPVPLYPSAMDMAHDISTVHLLNDAPTDVIRAQYQARIDEVERIRERFSEFISQNIKFDVFVCSHAAQGTEESLWAQQLCNEIKRVGLSVFYHSKQSSVNADLITYALQCAKLFVLVCDSNTDLNSSIVRNEYVKYHAIRSREERSKAPILVASTRLITDLPGIISGIRSVDITSPDSSTQVNDFISQIKRVKIKIKAKAQTQAQTQSSTVAPDITSIISADLKCMACGEPLSAENAADGVLQCPSCEYNNILPRANQKQEVLSLINEGDEHLRNADFSEAYNAYSKAAKRDPLESRAFFGASLAKNRVRYHLDRKAGAHTPICYAPTVDSVFSAPGIFAAHALAKNAAQKNAYTSLCDDIDLVSGVQRDLVGDKNLYDVFITVNPDDKIHMQAAEKLSNALKDSYYRPFVAEIDSRHVRKELKDDLILSALNSAKCMVVICDSVDGLSGSDAQRDYMTYYSMLPTAEKQSHNIIVFTDGSAVDYIPGIPEPITCLLRKSENAMTKLHDEVVDKVKAASYNLRYCENCERPVKPDAKVCPSCLSSRFNNNLQSIVNSNNGKKRGFWLNKKRVTKWMSQHARPVIFGVLAFVMAMIIAIAASVAAGADKKWITNEDFDITLSSESRIFEKGTELQVKEEISGTTYQWVKNEIPYRTNRALRDIRFYTIEYEAELDVGLTLSIPLKGEMKAADPDSIFVYTTDGETISKMVSSVSDGYVSVNTHELGMFAVAYLGEYNSSSGDGQGGTASGNTTELYSKLKAAESIDREKYTPTSLAQLDEEYALALGVFTNPVATQQQIDDSANSLATALSLLRLCANFEELKSAMSEAEKIFAKEDRYSWESVNSLRDHYDVALEIVSNKDLEQSAVDTATHNLRYSLDNMQKKRSGFGTFIAIVISAAAMILASYIMNENGVDGKLFVVWVIAVLALIIILSNYPLMAWWKAALIEVLIIAGATIWGLM